MDNATRTALSAALAGATVEQLRIAASKAMEGADHARDCGAFYNELCLQRLAALALAVAEMQERGHDGARLSMDESGCAFATDNASLVVSGPTLPAALAALLRGGA